MSLFASEALARAVAEVEGRDACPGVVRCDGHNLAVVMIEGSPLFDRPWVDYLEPVTGEATSSIRYLPRVAQRLVEEAQWHAEIAPTAASRLQAAPYVDWSLFSTWEDFLGHVRAQRSSLLKKLGRAGRQAERTLGEVVVDHDDRDPAAYELLMAWKQAHFDRTGLQNPASRPSNDRLFRALHADGALQLSTYRAAGRPIAAALHTRYAGRTWYWVPSFDRELHGMSPGNLLLLELLHASFDAGDEQFDFMIGDESYKWYFATHCRVVGPLGTAPLVNRARHLAGRARRHLRITLATPAAAAGSAPSAAPST